MSETAVNVPLLRKVMDHITAHPEEYDQREYAVRTDCGTTHCVAGWALALSGREFIFRALRVCDHRTAADFGWQAELGVVSGDYTHGAAAEALGLKWADAERLFDIDNTLPGVWRIVEELTSGEITRPAP